MHKAKKAKATVAYSPTWNTKHTRKETINGYKPECTKVTGNPVKTTLTKYSKL